MKKIILVLMLLSASAFADMIMECVMASVTQGGKYTVLGQKDYEANPELREPMKLVLIGEDQNYLTVNGKQFVFFREVKAVVWNGTPDAEETTMYAYKSDKDTVVGITEAFNEGGYRKIIFQHFSTKMTNGKPDRYVERQMTVTCEVL